MEAQNPRSESSVKTNQRKKNRLDNIAVNDKCIQFVETNVPSNLWKEVGTCLGINPVELDHIEYDYKDDGMQEVIHKMLTKWRIQCGSKATLNSLCEALCKTGLDDLASQINPELRVSAVPACGYTLPPRNSSDLPLTNEETRYVFLIKKKLLGHYENLELPGIPWEQYTLPLEELYVDLILHKVDKFGREKTTEGISLQEIFSSSSLGKNTRNPDQRRYLVLAGPGYGKTSMLKKIAYDWATGKEYVTRFELVIFLQLRHTETTFRDLVEKEARVSDDVVSIYSLLGKIQSKVLLLLDGYDEMPQLDHEDLNNLLKSSNFPDATVIVSSRTKPPRIDEVPIFWNRLIRIKGFNEEQAKEFLSRYLELDDPEYMWQKLDLVLTWSKAELLECPLFLLLLGRMVEENELKTIMTKTDLFEAAFNFMARRSLVKAGIIKTSEPFDLFASVGDESLESSSSSRYLQVIESFGEFAWQNLKKGTLVFLKSAVSENCKDDVIFDMGFLMQSNKGNESRRQRDYYEPVHKTFMEFAAALYLAKKSKTDNFEEEIKREIKELDRNGIMNMLSCFLFVDGIAKPIISLVVLLKDAIVGSGMNFYYDVLLKMSPQNKAETEELCCQFQDMMHSSVAIIDDANSFLLARLRLQQINVLECCVGLVFPIDSIDVDMLIVRFENKDKKMVVPLPSINTNHIVFDFRFSNDESEAWSDVRDIYLKLQDGPMPQVSFIFDKLSSNYLKQLCNLSCRTIQSLTFWDTPLNSRLLSELQNTLSQTQVMELEFIAVRDESVSEFLDIKHPDCKIMSFLGPYCMSTLPERNVPLAVSGLVPPKEWTGHSLVQELCLYANDAKDVDFSWWPMLRSLWLIDLTDEETFVALLGVLKKKRLDKLIIANSTITPFPTITAYSSTEDNDYDDLGDENSVKNLIIHASNLPDFIIKHVLELLVSKRVLRVLITEQTTTKFYLQKQLETDFELEIENVNLELKLFSHPKYLHWKKFYYSVKCKPKPIQE